MEYGKLKMPPIRKLQDFYSALPSYNIYVTPPLDPHGPLVSLLMALLPTAIMLVTISNFFIILTDFIVNIAIVLKIDYAIGFVASLTSLSILDIKTNQLLIYQYQTLMNIIIKNIKAIYCYCSLFIFVANSTILNIDNLLML